MSRFNLLTLTLAALVAAIILVTPIVAHAAYVTRPLTLLVWKGSLIEVYLNLTDAQQDLGLVGGQRYYFKFALGIAQPEINLPIVIRYKVGENKYIYCSVGYVPVDLTTAQAALWMTASLPYYQYVYNSTAGKGAIFVFDRNETNIDDMYLHIYNGTEWLTAKRVYVRVHFNSQLELKQAMEAVYGTNLPGACQELLSYCANGCTVDVLGLLIPPDANIASNTVYTLYYTVTVANTWRAMAKNVKAMDPMTYLESFTLNGIDYEKTNGTLAFGRNVTQEVLLANGKKLYIQGYVNVTIDWGALENDISQVLGSNLIAAGHNVTVTLDVVYKPTPTSLGTILASSGRIYEGQNYNNITAPNSLLTNATADTFISEVYGQTFGTYNNSNYLIFYLAVNPNVPLPLVNDWYEVKYGEYTVYLPVAEGITAIVVKLNQTIAYQTPSGNTLYINYTTIGLQAPANQTVPFWSTVAYLPLTGYVLKFVPSSLLRALMPSKFGDTDVMNPYDMMNVTVYNMVSNNTKFIINGNMYSILGNCTAGTFNRNVTALLPYIVLYGRNIVLTEAALNMTYNATGLAIGDILCRAGFNGTLHFTYTLPAAPYAGNLYYVVPVFKANLTSETAGTTARTFMALPPVNYTGTDMGNLLSGDAALRDVGTVIRVRPVAFAWPLQYYSNLADLAPNSSGNIIYGGYIVVEGIGYNLTDLMMNGKLYIGNASISCSKLSSVLSYPLLKTVVQPVLVRNATTGTFLVVVPLWRLYASGYYPLNGAKTGYITITVKGSGMDYDLNASRPLPQQQYTFNTKVRFYIASAGKFQLAINPYYKFTTAQQTMNGAPYTNYTVHVNAHAAGGSPDVVTAGGAWMKLKELGATEALANPVYYNYTHFALLIYGVPVTGGTYNVTAGTTPILTLTADQLAEGYYAPAMLVPTLQQGTYGIKVYNGTSEVEDYEVYFEIVPSAVFHSVRLGYTDMNVYPLYEQSIYAEIMALPNDTVEIYGYGWTPGYSVTIYADNVPRVTVAPTDVASDGTWEANYTVPGYKVGTTITLVVKQTVGTTTYAVAAYVKVMEIKRNGLLVHISTAPAIYDDGSLKLPVVVTVTYYDVPVACGAAHVTLIAKGVNLPAALQNPIDISSKCVAPGVWYYEINLGEVKTPVDAVIIAKVEYTVRGAKLTGFAATGVAIDPELKMYASEAATAASNALNEIRNVASKVEGIMEQLNGITATLNNMNGKLDQVLSKLAMLDKIDSDVMSAKDELKAAITNAAAAITSKLDTIASAVNAVKTTVEGLPTAVVNAVKQALANVPTKSDVKAMIDEAAKSIVSRLSGKLDNVVAAVNGVKTDLENMMSKCASDVKAAIESTMSKLESDIKSVKTSVENLGSAISDLKNSISSLKTSISNVKSSVDNLSRTLTSAINSIKSAVNSLKGSINSVSSAVSSLSGKLSDIDNKVGSVNTYTMTFGAATLVISIIVLALLILVAVKSGLLASH